MVAPISRTQLENASLDSDSLASFANGGTAVTVTARLGQTYPSIAKFLFDNQANINNAMAGALQTRLANKVSNSEGPSLVGLGQLAYPAETVGGALFTTVWANGATDVSAKLTTANAIGLPIRIIGSAVVSSAVTLTVPIVDTMAQIFASGAQITIDNGLAVRPEWFGSTAGNIKRAVDSLPLQGGIVLLANKTYPPSYNTMTAAMTTSRGGTPGTDYMIRKGVCILGSKLPRYTSGETALEAGTIIQGPFYISCECDSIALDKIGVDSGSAVCTALYSGAEQDALAIVQVNKTTPITDSRAYIGNVIGLCKIGSIGAHAVLIESMRGGHIEYAEGRRGFHGTVIKSRDMEINSLVGHGCGGEDVILKADTYAVCTGLKINSVSTGGWTGVESGVGLQIQAGTANVGAIQIGNVYTTRKDWGMVIVAGSNIIDSVTVTQLTAQSCSSVYQLSGDCRRVVIERINGTAGVYGAYITGAGDRSNAINDVRLANITNGVYCDGKISIGNVHLDTVTNGFVYGNTSANIMITGAVTSVGVTTLFPSMPTLVNSWVQHSGGDDYKLTVGNGKFRMEGLIQSGTNGTITTAVPANMRPAKTLRYPGTAFNGSVYAVAEINVSTTGVIAIANLAAATGASSYLSLNGVEWPIPF